MVVLTGMLGLVAIGFFAVWSLLSNIVSGLILFVTHPFKIGDKVEILPDGFKGEVLDITSFFVVIKSKGGVLHIPNNVMFQKVIKVLK